MTDFQGRLQSKTLWPGHPVLEARALTVRARKNVILDSVDVSYPIGVSGLLGPNGAGKTTLLRIFATVRRPTGGGAHVAGVDVHDTSALSDLRRIIGYLPQHLRFPPNFTARDFVSYVGWLKKVPPKELASRTAEVLEQVEMAHFADTLMRRLSGGMVRRVGIAQAIVNHPRVLLLDEPTTGLDPEQRVKFRQLVRELGAESTVLLSTHLVEDVAVTCAQLAVLTKGVITFYGSPAQLASLATGGATGDSDLERGYLTATAGSS